MKTLIKINLMLVAGLMVASCGPKYTANFSNSDSYYKAESKDLTPKMNIAQAEVVRPTEVSPVIEPNRERAVPVNVDRNLIASTASIQQIPEDLRPLVRAKQERIATIMEREPASKAEAKAQKREVLQVLKEVKKEVRQTRGGQKDNYILMMILAVLIPPLAVGLVYGVHKEFWISLGLTILFFIPGMIYSLIKVNQHYRGRR